MVYSVYVYDNNYSYIKYHRYDTNLHDQYHLKNNQNNID